MIRLTGAALALTFAALAVAAPANAADDEKKPTEPTAPVEANACPTRHARSSRPPPARRAR